MCGIIAAVSKHGGICARRLARATRRLRHRGPDAQHVWTSPDGRAGLGHARLSIIDLETGDQPIANEDEPAADRRQRRVVRLRADSPGARARRSRLPHAIGQRDRAAPLRGSRRARAAFAARRVRVRDLGRARRPALRGARPLRHQAALLHHPRRDVLSRVGGQGVRRARRAAALGSRNAVRRPLRRAPARSHAVRRHLSAPAGQLPADRRRAGTRHAVLGLGLPARRRDDARDGRRARVGRAPRSARSRKRSGCDCARTCRSPAT